jgi:hypothetical protein
MQLAVIGGGRACVYVVCTSRVPFSCASGLYCIPHRTSPVVRTDERGDHERGRLQLAAAPGGGVRRADLRTCKQLVWSLRSSSIVWCARSLRPCDRVLCRVVLAV